ncbi:MAG: alpha/beta hydrolase [Paracoccaceae bacterium]|nr:alpha/beta hydrolase [Paracoccaceae bacterium]
MISRRLRLLGGIIRPLARHHLARAQDPVRERRSFSLVSRLFFRQPTKLRTRPELRFQPGDDPSLWVSAGPTRPGKVLLYLHGGGFLVGSPRTHAAMVGTISALSGLCAFIPSYRLAPEHRLPAALEDAIDAHQFLLSEGFAPQDIIIGGDSAGGGLAFGLLAHLCQTGQRPAAVFAFSPFVDQTFSGASVAENAATDHFFPTERLADLPDMILDGLPAQDPRISPLFAEFPDPPPVMIQASSVEILRDDAVRMTQKLRAAGGQVILQLWDGAPHVWQLLDGWFPEARAALIVTANFIRHQLPPEGEN